MRDKVFILVHCVASYYKMQTYHPYMLVVRNQSYASNSNLYNYIIDQHILVAHCYTYVLKFRDVAYFNSQGTKTACQAVVMRLA